MIEIVKPTKDPYFNIAAEEYVTHHLQEEVFMLWENNDCIVVGKHQNSLSEVNLAFIQESGIPVIRRISGGGTVFQGEGNLNFSFVTHHQGGEEKINFERATAPIISFLASHGIRAVISNKSNITVNDLKISGNAAHIHKNSILHHGTLLFDADLEKVSKAIQSKPDAYQTKAIASNRVPIANAGAMMHPPMSRTEFTESLRTYIRQYLRISQVRNFTEKEIIAIEQLAAEKYRSWEWNFGYSPDYHFTRTITIEEDAVDFQLHIHRGVIVNLSISKSSKPAMLICQTLSGTRHHEESLREKMQKAELHRILGMEACNLIIQQLLYP